MNRIAWGAELMIRAKTKTIRPGICTRPLGTSGRSAESLEAEGKLLKEIHILIARRGTAALPTALSTALLSTAERRAQKKVAGYPGTTYIHTYIVDYQDKGPRAPQHRGNHRSRGRAAIALPLLHPRTPNRGWSTVALFPVPPDPHAPPRCHAPPEGGQGLALPNQTPLSQEGLLSGPLARDLFQPR